MRLWNEGAALSHKDVEEAKKKDFFYLLIDLAEVFQMFS